MAVTSTPTEAVGEMEQMEEQVQLQSPELFIKQVVAAVAAVEPYTQVGLADLAAVERHVELLVPEEVLILLQLQVLQLIKMVVLLAVEMVVVVVVREPPQQIVMVALELQFGE
jgi:hypothetical protein